MIKPPIPMPPPPEPLKVLETFGGLKIYAEETGEWVDAEAYLKGERHVKVSVWKKILKRLNLI